MLLQGKKGLIMGVANDKSIAWGIAQLAHKHGAQLAFSYQGEVLQKRVVPLAESVGAKDEVYECDVQNDESIDALFAKLEQKWENLDFIVHGIAFSDKDELRGGITNTSRKNFAMSMDISCYSFIAVAKAGSKLMKNGGSMLTMTYYGAEKVIPNYNIMGVAKAALECSVKYLAADLGAQNIRVNAISAGPIKTLAASGIGDFRSMLNYNEQNTPLCRNVSQEDVGGTGVFLISDLSTGITGENIHVDSGAHVMGTPKKLGGEN
ncbi:enoyl-ACP reductase FabI [Candidatus Deianiraea vastatrix]|uniref:Enoyl-[acyl-carrier-protein] reductase [NADH] n=1 Tax=Candidatus Deianiraea vastatrix TaxID=2163644 RepID=A0A5B8XDG6_9RICK|nr:enoyl-ACP reductase [Candidatus Deianiraea vastatrix]QED22925.1 Enoyl-[acyl-carrier-protein] reductase [NADH] FabI [Candidatus Deianiraea vastatrix]